MIDLEGSVARKVSYCSRCVMPDSRPRIIFDKEGVCNACKTSTQKDQIDWQSRRRQFMEVIEPYRSKGGWDCIVPWSGGKDSSSIAHKLKFDFGLNPLLVTFAPMMPTLVGAENREALIQEGFDHIYVRPNQKVQRRLARRFFIERGNPKVPWEAGVNTIPLQLACQFSIPLVFFAEHGESEYGGRVLHEDSCKFRDFSEVIEHQVGDDPQNWVDDQIATQDLSVYLYPEHSNLSRIGVIAYYFAYFFRWSILDNYDYVKKQFPFKTCASGRTNGTFTDYDSLDDKIDNLYYYMQFIKFGFGRTVRDACRLIQNDQMTRSKAVALVKKYDHEFPKDDFQEVLDYLRMDRKEFDETVNRHRNAEIWKVENKDWVLRFPLS
jgi:N-acetyl sugar amidotransferase